MAGGTPRPGWIWKSSWWGEWGKTGMNVHGFPIAKRHGEGGGRQRAAAGNGPKSRLSEGEGGCYI